MVYGEVHKPELFNDREGKPQISLEITAMHLEFSPFGKPASAGSSQEAAEPAPATGHHVAAPFGVVQESGALNPYIGGGKPGGGEPRGAGETFDDEVPF